MLWAKINIFHEHQDLNVVMFWYECISKNQDLNVSHTLGWSKYFSRTARSECCHVLGRNKCISRTPRSECCHVFWPYSVCKDTLSNPISEIYKPNLGFMFTANPFQGTPEKLYCTLHVQYRTLVSLFTRYQINRFNTAMFIWSGCILG